MPRTTRNPERRNLKIEAKVDKPSAARRALPIPPTHRESADTFKAEFDTTKGKFTIEVTRSLSPNGADRFYNSFIPDTSRTSPSFV